MRPLLFAALLASGCASTQTLDLGDPAARRALAERAAVQPAEVVFADGSVVEARLLRVAADSASWLDDSGAVRTAATSTVVRVLFPSEDPRRGLSGGQGAAVGAAVGTAAGAALYGALYRPNVVFDRTAWTLGGATVGLVIGAGTGALVASGRLRPERYVVTPSPVPR